MVSARAGHAIELAKFTLSRKSGCRLVKEGLI
jgi:hypothetical protein